MLKSLALLLLAAISQCLCGVTWISPLDGDTETLAEDTNINSLIVSLNATSSNTIAYYIMRETLPGDTFGIQNQNVLYLKSGLDYEATKSHAVVIRAHDRTSYADILLNITVSDINDETPVITSDTTKDLQTNTAIGSVVFTVTSTDKDTVGTVTYSIIGGNDKGDFSINATTGEITLKTVLNITVTPEYDLDIKASDGVNIATQTITFYVTDIIWGIPLDGQTDLIAENTTVDYTITTLNAENALAYSFEVVPASEKSKFRIRDANLTLEQSLDFETIKLYIFILTAIGTSPSAVITYTVNVTDINDEPPVFAAEIFNLDLTKDTDIDTVVYTAEVTDPDTVGSTTFSITSGNANADFIIDTMTGDLTLDNTLDPDVTAAYSLVIEATDSVYTATMTLSITVNNVVWTDPPKGTSEYLPEDTAVNTVIKNLTAETATTYIIRRQTPYFDQFGIINDIELVLLSQLDYEKTTSHIISLRATDVSGKSADITYIVNVTDVNDLDPVFVSGTFEVIPENTPVGSTIHTVAATDGDTVGTVSYSITAGNDDGMFSIDSGSGNITLDSALIPNTTDDLSYNLIIEATDSLHPVTQSFTINIKTVPVLILPVNGTTITENADTSGPLEVLVLDSIDLDNDQAPEYSIDTQSHPGTFSISDDNTQLITTASFDRETVSEYIVIIRVTDSSEFDLSSASPLIVTIEDENDVSPTFTSKPTLRLADDTPALNEFIVYTAMTHDPDVTGTVSYSFIAGNTHGDFNMNSNGSITLSNVLNASITTTYTLIIVADDTVNTTPFNLTVYVVKDCEDPPVAINSARTFTTTTENSHATYTCNTGYSKAAGDDVLTCNEDRKWIGTVPTCIADCAEPPVANANSVRKFTTTTEKSHATYTCNTGFSKVAGDDVLTCDEDAKWIGTLPICFADVGVIQNSHPAISGGAISGWLSLAVILVVAVIFVTRRYMFGKVCKRVDTQVENNQDENGGSRDYMSLQHSQASVTTPTYYDSLTHAKESTNPRSTESETYANAEI